jgi:type IV pilus assembly protein PilW
MANVGNVQLQPNNYAVLSQCDKAEVFKITGTEAQVNAGTINHGSGALGDDNALPAFEKDFTDTSSAELRRVAVTTYYIADNDNGIPTLYRDIDNVSDPLVEGVERMQIEYGINTDDTTVNVPDEYHDAQWVDAQGVWGDVVSVRLSFIMRSKQPLYDQDVAKTYSLPGAVTYSYAVNDRFARVVYTATVNLRNRSLGVRI